MEDGASQWMNLVAAIFTFVALAATDTVVARVDDATVGAGREITVRLIEHVIKAGSIVLKSLVKLLDRERLTHITSVLQRLHVVKG